MKRLILILTILIFVRQNSNEQTACTNTQGFYGLEGTMSCYDDSIIINSTQFMLNAFGTKTSKVFGNVTNKRFFTLYKTDVTNKNIFKMLPAAGTSQMIGVDNVLPYNGAYYDDQSTWSLVPIQPTGPAMGRMKNLLLAQTITLWFNIRTSSTLGTISLADDTLVTSAQAGCGSGIPTGTPSKFGLPHGIIMYLNGGNGYNNNVNGLFRLANDRLGGANTSVSILNLQAAVTTINEAFEECRILVGTIPASAKIGGSEKTIETQSNEKLVITLNPNPGSGHFILNVRSDHNSPIKMIVFDVSGKILESKIITANQRVSFGDDYRPGLYFIRLLQGKEHKELKLVKLAD